MRSISHLKTSFELHHFPEFDVERGGREQHHRKSKKIKIGNKKKDFKKKITRPCVARDACLHCKKSRHWKNECPELKRKAGPSGTLCIFPIIDISLALDANNG